MTFSGCSLVQGSKEAGLCQLRAGNLLINLVDVEGKQGKHGGPAPGNDGHKMGYYSLSLEQ